MARALGVAQGGRVMARERQPRCPFCGQLVTRLDGLTDSDNITDESDNRVPESWHLCPNTSGLISAAAEQRQREG
jgi:hypothetical protein